jgi:hypothetical protein
MSKHIFGAAFVLAVAGSALATNPSIDVGKLPLTPESTAWEYIYVTGGQEVQGLEFNVNLTDGASGPFLSGSGVDILTGTIFAANNTGEFPGSYKDWWTAYKGTVTSSGTVSADGLLARLFIASYEVPIGSYPISLTNTPEGPTNFAGVPADITNGTVVVTKLGDVNADLKVDILDLTDMAGHWGQNVGVGGWLKGDCNGDGTVDILDLTDLAGNWGWDLGGGAAAPEPTSLLLLGLGIPALMRRRRA